MLRLDPYPKLAGDLAQHPEVAHNSVFFIGGSFGAQQYSETRASATRAIESVLEGLDVLTGLMTAMLTMAWLARAVTEHRRWLRATNIPASSSGNARSRACGSAAS